MESETNPSIYGHLVCDSSPSSGGEKLECSINIVGTNIHIEKSERDHSY